MPTLVELLLALCVFSFFAVPFFSDSRARRICGRCGGGGTERFTDVQGDFHFERCEVCRGTGWVRGRE